MAYTGPLAFLACFRPCVPFTLPGPLAALLLLVLAGALPPLTSRLQDSIATDVPQTHLGQNTLPSPPPAQLRAPALLSASPRPYLTNTSQAVGLLPT